MTQQKKTKLKTRCVACMKEKISTRFTYSIELRGWLCVQCAKVPVQHGEVDLREFFGGGGKGGGP